MLWTPPFGGFSYITGNGTGLQPAAPFGTAITPAQNSYGSWTEIVSDTDVTQDCYAIAINFNGGNVSGQARDIIVNIGVDESGGTSYATIIPHLLASSAGLYNSNTGINYFFPLLIKAGSAIAAQASINNATVGTVSCAIWLYGAPATPELLKYGTFVEAIGAVTASSRGSAASIGTASEGAYQSLGTTVNDLWAWQMGIGCNSSTFSNNAVNWELAVGDATNKKTIIHDMKVVTSTIENLDKSFYPPIHMAVPAGSTLYTRGQGVTNSPAMTAIAYGVGG